MTRALRTACLAVLLLLPGCGLPLPAGVQSAGEVRAEREEPPPLQVLPAGPQTGATPEDVVRGFLDAQISPEDDHAIARQFLAPGTAWDTTKGAVVYKTRRFQGDNDGDPLTFQMRFEVTARISPEGAYAPQPGVERIGQYVVAQQPTGEFRLVEVPAGLHLQSEDRPLSFTPYNVYFHPRSRAGTSGPLVPDRVFLPRTEEPAPALVEALLRGPTAALARAVQPALPFDAVATTVTVADQVVTLDLPDQVLQLDRAARRQLAAQVVWTVVPAVPTFVGVRLQVGGQELEVSGAPEVQTPRDWPEYDPAGVNPQAPLYYLQGRALRSLRALPPSGATRGQILVDGAAVSPRGDDVGLLTRHEGAAPDEVRTGAIAGPFGAPVLRKPDLASLTWGSGDPGLWVLERGPRPIVWLVPPPDAPVQVPRQVTYDPPPGVGPLSTIRVSRDGARIAMVFGAGPARRLFVAVVERDGDVPHLSRPLQVAPRLTDVSDVAWGTGTSLVVLASSGAQPLVQTVTVDGSTEPVPVPRQGSEPVQIAAAPGLPTVIAQLDQGTLRLYVDNGQFLSRRNEPGSRPFYPG